MQISSYFGQMKQKLSKCGRSEHTVCYHIVAY